MMDLKGHGVALVTPFSADGGIDFEALRLHLERMISSGVDYLVVSGTTAETATLSAQEKAQLQSFVVDTVAGRLPLVIGIGGNNTQAVIQEIQETDLRPFQAILSVCPYYNKPNQEGLYQHFKAIALATDVPVILYNVPGRTACNLAPQTVVQLAESFSNIIAIKEAAGDFAQVQELIRKTPESFQVISGEDALVVPVILAGGVGVISVIGNLLPDRFSRLIDMARNHHVTEANNEQYALMDLIQLLFKEGNPIGLKAALHLQGYCENVLRLPLVPASNALQQALRNEMTLLHALV